MGICMCCSVGRCVITLFSVVVWIAHTPTPCVNSRRSSTMRTYAGDTSLPGGKVEPGDRHIEDTAVSGF